MQAPFADPLSGIELLITPLPLVGREAEMRVICALLDTVAQQKPVGARAPRPVGRGNAGRLAEGARDRRKRQRFPAVTTHAPMANLPGMVAQFAFAPRAAEMIDGFSAGLP